MENEQGNTAGQPERVRLQGFDEPGWAGHPEPWPRATPRDVGVRTARRASNVTAAALIAAVAVTTGYLAHESAPAATSGGTGTSTHAGKSTAVAPGAPAVSGPVVTSGGSGATAGRGGDT
jgi:hypothetical protein